MEEGANRYAGMTLATHNDIQGGQCMYLWLQQWPYYLPAAVIALIAFAAGGRTGWRPVRLLLIANLACLAELVYAIGLGLYFMNAMTQVAQPYPSLLLSRAASAMLMFALLPLNLGWGLWWLSMRWRQRR